MNKFEQGFSDFIRNKYPKAEVITDKIKGKIDFSNADYFFNERRVICELKCLEKEGYVYIHTTLQDLLNKKEIPIFYNGMTIGEALKNHPKEGAIKLRLFNQITSSLEGALEKANRQIRETKKEFNLSNSEGIILFVNLDNTGLEPHIARDCLHMLIVKKDSKGDYRYKDFSFIFYISHVHFQRQSENRTMMPFLVMTRKDTLSKEDEQFLNEFRAQWSAFMNLPVDDLTEMTSGDFLKIEPFISKEKDIDSLIKER